jgi:enterobactin synthetase component D
MLGGAATDAGAEPWATVELPVSLRNAVAKRQMQFRAGRFCAATALRALAPHLAAASVGRAASGAPIWPAGVAGSITHTDDFVSVAVAWTSEVPALGIDTERIVSNDRARNLSSTVAIAGELALAREAGCTEAQAFTLAFSAKEAVFKCLHASVGRRFGFHDARLVSVDANGTFRARLVTALAPHVPAGTILDGRFELEATRVHTGVMMTFEPGLGNPSGSCLCTRPR